MVPTDTDALYPYSTRAYGVVESAVAPIAVTGSTVTTISSASSKAKNLFMLNPPNCGDAGAGDIFSYGTGSK